MKLLQYLLSPVAWCLEQFANHEIKKQNKNKQWRENIKPGEGCYVYDITGHKVRVEVVSVRAGAKGDVTVMYYTKQGTLVKENYRKIRLFKY